MTQTSAIEEWEILGPLKRNEVGLAPKTCDRGCQDEARVTALTVDRESARVSVKVG